MLQTILHPTPKWGPGAPTLGPGSRPLEVVASLSGNSRARPGPIAMAGGKVPPADRSGGSVAGKALAGASQCCCCFAGSGRRGNTLLTGLQLERSPVAYGPGDMGKNGQPHSRAGGNLGMRFPVFQGSRSVVIRRTLPVCAFRDNLRQRILWHRSCSTLCKEVSNRLGGKDQTPEDLKGDMIFSGRSI